MLFLLFCGEGNLRRKEICLSLELESSRQSAKGRKEVGFWLNIGRFAHSVK